ncbi:MAG: AAA family ATPase, partial [Myxococcota bacterium]
MGVVYQGHHPETGAQVAIKVVKMLDERRLSGIRRELRALVRLKHPGIVQVLDHGTQDGLPWYAMEFIRGAPLSSWVSLPTETYTSPTDPTHTAHSITGTLWADSLVLADGGGEPRMLKPGAVGYPDKRPKLTAARLRQILEQVHTLCDSLAYLHGEGIVHGDLKPENVMVRREDNQPILVDFGLMSHFAGGDNRESLEIRERAGTPAYMAPELRSDHGVAMDARADLYALGCILYALVCGHPPNTSHGPLETKVYEPMAAYVDGVPEALDTLVERLLAKEPSARIGHADVVATHLEALGVKTQRTQVQPRAYLYQPTMAGRQQAMAQLTGQLEQLTSTPYEGGLTLIAGTSGVGKTRLVMELARLAQSQGLRTLVGECTYTAPSAKPTNAPLAVLRRPLRRVVDHCRAQGPQETLRVLGDQGAYLAPYEPALLSLPLLTGAAHPPQLAPEAARLRVCVALTHVLCMLAKAKPVLLVLDDLQWADELTLAFLNHIARNSALLEQQRLRIVGTYRVEEVADHRALQHLSTQPAIHTIELGRLDEAAIETVVGEMLALDKPPREVVTFVAEQSEGNPFFVAEYLHAMVEAKLLGRNAMGQWHWTTPQAQDLSPKPSDVPMPDSLKALVALRLDGLDGPTRRLVDQAAVFGREMERIPIEQASSLTPEQFSASVETLLARRIFEGPRLATTVRFTHGQIREAVYTQLTDTQRHSLHHQAAVCLEQHVHQSPEHHATLGHHWRLCGHRDKAYRCYRQAALHAKHLYAYDDAAQLMEIAIAQCDDPTERMLMHL